MNAIHYIGLWGGRNLPIKTGRSAMPCASLIGVLFVRPGRPSRGLWTTVAAPGVAGRKRRPRK
jgi:hypothetical protein